MQLGCARTGGRGAHQLEFHEGVGESRPKDEEEDERLHLVEHAGMGRPYAHVSHGVGLAQHGAIDEAAGLRRRLVLVGEARLEEVVQEAKAAHNDPEARELVPASRCWRPFGPLAVARGLAAGFLSCFWTSGRLGYAAGAVGFPGPLSGFAYRLCSP